MDNCNLKQTNCDLCQKKFISKNPNTQLIAHLKWCVNKHKFLTKYNFTSAIIQREYNICGSVLSFKEKFPFWNNFTHYYRLFKEMNINYSLQKSLASKESQIKRRKTSLNRYGIESNFEKNSKSRLKWEKRLLETEGITNVFQRESVKEKSLLTLISKYGKEYWNHNSTIRGSNIISKLNKKVFSILESNNINFSIEFKLKKEKGYYAYDILLENSNKIIEIYGDYWHGNPRIYKDNDIILKGSSKEILVKDKWKNDKEKELFAINKNYQILIIWEYDLKNNKENCIKKILNYINL